MKCHWIHSVLLASLIACDSSTQISEGGLEPAEDDSKPTVTRPQNVTGTFLACHETVAPKEANVSSSSSTIGCGFYDEKDESRKEVKEFSKSIDWSYESSVTEVKVSVPETTDSYLYDVYYTFAVDQSKLANVLEKFTIIFVVEDLEAKKITYSNNFFIEDSKKVNSKPDLGNEPGSIGTEL